MQKYLYYRVYLLVQFHMCIKKNKKKRHFENLLISSYPQSISALSSNY